MAINNTASRTDIDTPRPRAAENHRNHMKPAFANNKLEYQNKMDAQKRAENARLDEQSEHERQVAELRKRFEENPYLQKAMQYGEKRRQKMDGFDHAMIYHPEMMAGFEIINNLLKLIGAGTTIAWEGIVKGNLGSGIDRAIDILLENTNSRKILQDALGEQKSNNHIADDRNALEAKTAAANATQGAQAAQNANLAVGPK